MAGIVPIPSTRVSDSFVRQRLLSQVQNDQTDLFLLQNQISTGRRLNLPSDDATAALRGMALQNLLERKAQIKTNITTNQSYLGATDSALGNVTDLLTQARGEALTAINGTSTAQQREAAAIAIDSALQQLMHIGNQQFRGRYLFAGGATTRVPFSTQNGKVVYAGDEKSIFSYSDIDSLFATNLDGSQVFGALSQPVRGSTDLNPVLTADTPLEQLRGGAGARSAGSLLVSDGSHTTTVDVTNAQTVGEIARLLEANPPAGRTVTARITNTGITVSLDAAGGGTLTIKDVGGSSTAAELGILQTVGTSTTIVGTDLNPRLTNTTPLANLLGGRASVSIASLGPNNDLIVRANSNGAVRNGIVVKYVDDSLLQAGAGLSAGSEVANFTTTATAAVASLQLPGASNDLLLTATAAGTSMNGVTVNIVNGGNIGDAAGVNYNAGTKTLTLTIDDTDETSIDTLVNAINAEGTFTVARDSSVETNVAGGIIPTSAVGVGRAKTANTGSDANTLVVRVQSGATTANQVIAAIATTGQFTASLDMSEHGNTGEGVITDSFLDTQATGVTADGAGEVLDQTSGIRVSQNGTDFNIDISSASTVEDLLNLINGSGAGVLASINAAGTGIDIRSRTSGADFSIGENGGTTATQLGVRSSSASTPLSQLNYGKGVHTAAGADFTVHRKDGVEFDIDVDGATSISDVIDRINNNAVNLSTGTPVVARLAKFGNGIELVNDGFNGSDGTLSVRRANLSQAAIDLGLIPAGADQSTPAAGGDKAAATVSFVGANNDLVISGAYPGESINGVTVSFVDTGLGAGNETVTYDPNAKTLVFNIDSATTTAAMAASRLAADPTASKFFTASLAVADGSPNNGTGLVAVGSTATLAGGKGDTLTGKDPNPVEADGAFTALIRLSDALRAGDNLAIQRAVEVLDSASLKVDFSRAELGARQQGLDVLQTRLDNEDVELNQSLSNDIDVDITKAISDLTARQASYQASLQVAGQIRKLSLLDYL